MDARWVGGKGICHHQPDASHPGAAQKGSTSTEQQSVCSQNWPWPAVAYSLHLHPDPSKCENVSQYLHFKLLPQLKFIECVYFHVTDVAASRGLKQFLVIFQVV